MTKGLVEVMFRVVDAWDCTGNGDFILQMNEKKSGGAFKKCRIANEEYSIVPVHLFGLQPNILLKYIGIRANKNANFVGQEIEFIKATEGKQN